MNNTLTLSLEKEETTRFLVWAKTPKAIELVWTGNSGVLAVYQLIKAKAEYKKLVKLEWV